MTISEAKMQMVIANYFKDECDVNTSIRQAFEKGFRIGVKKGASTNRPQEWIPCSERLPEYRKLVLVTTRDLRVKPAYLDSIQDDGTDDWWSIPLDDADCALWNIVAWMPLPNPWKGADYE